MVEDDTIGDELCMHCFTKRSNAQRIKQRIRSGPVHSGVETKGVELGVAFEYFDCQPSVIHKNV